MKKLHALFTLLFWVAIIFWVNVLFLTIANLLQNWLSHITLFGINLYESLESADLGIYAAIGGFIIYFGYDMAIENSEGICKSSFLRKRYWLTMLILIGICYWIGKSQYPLFKQCVSVIKQSGDYESGNIVAVFFKKLNLYNESFNYAWSIKPFPFRVFWSSLMCAVGTFAELGGNPHIR